MQKVGLGVWLPWRDGSGNRFHIRRESRLGAVIRLPPCVCLSVPGPVMGKVLISTPEPAILPKKQPRISHTHFLSEYVFKKFVRFHCCK